MSNRVPVVSSRVRLLAGLVLVAVLTASASARAQDRPTREQPVSAQSLLARLHALDPQLRKRASEAMRAEVALRRSRWDRVRGAIGVRAGHLAESTGWLATDGDTSRQSGDHFGAALVADLRIPLYAGGALSGNEDAARERVASTRYATEATRRQLERSALVAYAQAIATRGMVDVAKDARDRAVELEAFARTRAATGVGIDADVARARLNRLQREEELLTREGERDVADALLRAVMLIDDERGVRPTESLDALATWGGRARGTPPALLALEAEARAASQDVKVARSGTLPTVELFAGAQYGNGHHGLLPFNSGPFSSAPPPVAPSARRVGPFAGSAAAGVLVSWTAFDFFVTRDRARDAELAAAVARADVEELRRTYRQAVQESRARETQARRRATILRQGEGTAGEAVRLARARYESGNSVLTEVLDAELEGIAVQQRQVQAAYELAVAHLDRLHAEGAR